MFSRWQTAQKGASKAHTVLRALRQGPFPAGITGAQALDRKTRAEQLRRRAVESLGRIDARAAVDALVGLLLLGDRDRDENLVRSTILALRSSTAPGIVEAIAERALREGIEVLAAHRDPRLQPRLEAAIASDEQTMPRWWCIAVCMAASYGHAPSRARLGELFGNPVGLADVRWLAPMLAALASGPPDEVWDLTAPVREILLRDPRPVGRVEGPLVSVLLAAVGARPEVDARWTDLAFEISTHANANVAWRAAGALTLLARDDEALRRRMVEQGTPLHFAVLADLGDERARKHFVALLGSDSLVDIERAARGLKTLGALPRELVEPAVVRAVRSHDELVDDELYMVLEQLERFADGSRVDELLAAVESAVLVTDNESRSRARELLVEAIEALRP